MEGISILHQELARTHDPESWPDFIAELGLDLEEVERQLFVRTQLAARQIGNNFLVGRAVAVFGILAVSQFQQLPAAFLPAAVFVPHIPYNGRETGRARVC